MGFLRTRTDRNGSARYTACYLDLKGRERSAGTFTSKREATKAWQAAELKLAEGRVGDPARGRQRFRAYVEDVWLPNHVMELRTREGYTYRIHKRLLPEFGEMRMVEILPAHVREFMTALQAEGMKPATIKTYVNILSAIFTTALNDQITFLHPCKGVKLPTVAVKPLTIITAEQFDVLYAALPDNEMRLLVETDIESGLRWGELTELRVKDLDLATGILTVSRTVVELVPEHHPEGKRFVVKEYPKNRKYRRFKLSAQIVAKLRAHIEALGLGPDDLLFGIRDPQPVRPVLRILPDPDTLGLTEPNDKGRRYRHGTLTGYGDGRCRCRHCRDAFAIYRARRRAAGKDRGPARRARMLETDGHIPRNWFRNHVWKLALEQADLRIHVRIRDLRHAHASWLLAGGADLEVVRDRLGHSSIVTTQRYLHTLPDADETALDALDRVRSRKPRPSRDRSSG
jgi:integrase